MAGQARLYPPAGDVPEPGRGRGRPGHAVPADGGAGAGLRARHDLRDVRVALREHGGGGAAARRAALAPSGAARHSRVGGGSETAR